MANNFLLPSNTAPASNTRVGVVKIGTGIEAATDGTISLADSGVTAGTYFKTTVDAMGRVTAGSNPTTLSGFGITDALSNINAIITQSATVKSATTLALGSDTTKVLNVQDSASTSIFSVAQSGLTTIKTQVNKASGTSTDEAFRIESLDANPLFQVMTNGDAKIAGVITVSGTGTSTFAGDVAVGGRLTVAEGITGSGTTAELTADDFTVKGKLVVQGNTELGDNASQDTTTIKGVTTIYSKATMAAGSASIAAFKVLSSDSASLFEVRENGDAVIGGVLTVNGTGQSHFAGGLDIDGDVDIGGSLTVHKDATVDANLQGDNLTLTGNLVVKGNSTLGDDAATDTTSINGVTTVKSGVTKASGSTSNAAFKVVDSADAMLFQVSTNGDVKVSNNLSVAAGATVQAAMSGQNLSLTGNLTVTGDSTLNGNVTLGDNSSDTIQSKSILNMNNNRITNVAIPTSVNDAATKGYVDGLVQGLDIKGSARVATTGNLAGTYASGVLTASAVGALSIDGITLAVGNRVLVKNQTDGKQNGIYTVTAIGDSSNKFVLTRASDFDSNESTLAGAFVFVEEGTTNHDSGWVCSADSVVMDTTAIVWTQFSGAGSFNGGAGIGQSGNTFSLLPATTTTLGGVIVSDTADTSVDASGNLSIKADSALTANYIVRRDGSGKIFVNGIDASSGGLTTTGAISGASITGSGNLAITGTSTLTGAATFKNVVAHESKISKVANVATEGNFGVNTTTKNVSDTAIPTTQTTVASFTPTAAGNFMVYVYFRVVTAATTLALELDYSDGSGAQQQIILPAGQAQAVGSYSVTPIFVNAVTSAPIALKAQAGTASQVFMSANIVAL